MVAPLSSPACLDGSWEDEDGVLLEIKGGVVCGPDGGKVELSLCDGRVRACVGEDPFEATLSGDGRLCWNDGTVWLRQEPKKEREPSKELAGKPRTPRDANNLFDFDELDDVMPAPQKLLTAAKEEPTKDLRDKPDSPRGPNELFDFDELDDAMSTHFVERAGSSRSSSSSVRSGGSRGSSSKAPAPPPQQPAPGRSFNARTQAAPEPPRNSAPGRPGQPGTGQFRSSAPSGPKVVEEDSATRRLREQCTQEGLAVGWCKDADTLATLLRRTTEWRHYGVCSLKDELSHFRVPLGGFQDMQREGILRKLRTVLVWQHLSVPQLQAECNRRKIPFDRTSRLQQILDDSDDEGEDKRRKREQADLVRRLVQDTYEGAPGPLQPIPGIWSPSHAKGLEPPPAWTGDLPAGWKPQPQQQQRPPAPPPAPPPARGAAPAPSPAEAARAAFAAAASGEPPSWEAPPKRTPDSGNAQKPKALPAQANRAEPHHYAVLGLAEDASAAEVRRAYRQLALRFHPDKNAEGAARFRKIAEAYEEIVHFL